MEATRRPSGGGHQSRLENQWGWEGCRTAGESAHWGPEALGRGACSASVRSTEISALSLELESQNRGSEVKTVKTSTPAAHPPLHLLPAPLLPAPQPSESINSNSGPCALRPPHPHHHPCDGSILLIFHSTNQSQEFNPDPCHFWQGALSSTLSLPPVCGQGAGRTVGFRAQLPGGSCRAFFHSFSTMFGGPSGGQASRSSAPILIG